MVAFGDLDFGAELATGLLLDARTGGGLVLVGVADVVQEIEGLDC